MCAVSASAVTVVAVFPRRLTLGADVLRIEGPPAAGYATQVRTGRDASACHGLRGVREGEDVASPATRGAQGSGRWDKAAAEDEVAFARAVSGGADNGVP